MRRFLLFVISTAALSFLFLLPLSAQTNSSAPKQLRATKFRIENPDFSYGSKLYVTINDKVKKIYDKACRAWIINNGKEVVFSAPDGSGGFENEGQSLRIYNVETGKMKKILSEYFFVEALTAVKLTNGQTALLVKMSDDGLGAPRAAVVDPQRGEVLYKAWAEITKIKGDEITLAYYTEEAWNEMEVDDGPRVIEEQDPNNVVSKSKAKSHKSESFDLKKILKNKVIYNKPNI